MPATKRINGAEFLYAMYNPPLGRFPDPEEDRHGWARAEAWGKAVQGWLVRYGSKKNRNKSYTTLARLLNACRKLPWEVRLEDGQRWVEETLERYTPRTRGLYIYLVISFYQYACEQTWTTPKGRTVRVCRTNPVEALPKPKRERFLKAVPLSEEELERLFEAFDIQTLEGRRERAVFQIILETGLRLRQVLQLTYGELRELVGARQGFETAAWKEVMLFLEQAGRTASIEQGEYVFTRFRTDCIGQMVQNRPEKATIKRNTLHYYYELSKWHRTETWYSQPIGTNALHQAFREAVIQAGLDCAWVTVETLRYTGARRLLEAGSGQKEVAEFLQFKDPRHIPALIRTIRSTERKSAERQPNQQVIDPRERSLQSLKHGRNCELFNLKKLGIQGHKISGVPSERLPETIVRLRLMTRELFEQPSTGSAVEEAQRLLKLSHMAETIGKLKKRLADEEWGKGPDGVKGKGMRLCAICPEAEACADSPVCPLLGEEGEDDLEVQGLAEQDFAGLREWLNRRPRLGEKRKRGKREGKGMRYEELEARLREVFGEKGEEQRG